MNPSPRLPAPPLPAPAWRSLPPAVQGLMLGEFLGLLSTASMQMALAWWIGREAGAGDLARYGSLMGAAALFLTPLLSPAGDRWRKRSVIRMGRLMLVADAGALAVLCWTGTYSLTGLCLCGLWAAAATALLWPAEASVLAEVVTPDLLPTAIRWRRAAQAAGGFIGPGVGGLVVASLGLGAAMALNLGLFVLAAGCAWWVALPQGPDPGRTSRRWWAELADGLRAKWLVRLDRWWTLAGAVMMLSFMPATGMLLPLRLQALGLSAAWFGACTAALSVGVLAGVAGLAPWAIAQLGRVRALALAILTCSAAVAGIGLCEAAPMLAALFALIGLCVSVTQLVGQTHRMLAMPATYRARMTAAHLTVAHAVAALAPVIAGGLLQQSSIAAVYLMLASAFAASGLLLLLVPGLGTFLRLDHGGVEGWYGRHYPQAFKRG